MTDPRELIVELRADADYLESLYGKSANSALVRHFRAAADYIEQTLAAVPDEVEGLVAEWRKAMADVAARGPWIARCSPDAIAGLLDTIRAQAALIAEKNKALEEYAALITALRQDLQRFIGADPTICEGCGAPIDNDEDASTVSEVDGCWGYVADVKGAPCYRYRTEAGADRSWPPCDLAARRARNAGGGDGN